MPAYPAPGVPAPNSRYLEGGVIVRPISSGSRLRQRDAGRYAIEDDFLVLRPADPGRKQSRYRITGAGRSGDGRGSFLPLGITRDDFPFLSAGSTRPRAGDLYAGVR